jgi:hypothetical protein
VLVDWSGFARTSGFANYSCPVLLAPRHVKRWLRRAAWELASGLTAKLSAAPAS